MFIYFISQ